MIHLCTIATLMFLQNNTSQKILFFAARTIQFPGVVFKVCIYLIVAIVTSSLYFDVKSTHTLSKIYISNHIQCQLFLNDLHDHHHQTPKMLLFKVRKRNRQDLLAKKEALDLDVASLRLNDNSVRQKHG